MPGIADLKKIDLHTHLAGNLEPEFLLELASSHQVPLTDGDKEALRNSRMIGKNSGSLTEYLKIFSAIKKCMQTQKALEQCAFHACERAAADNTAYIELRFSPLTHTENGLSGEQVVESVLQGLRSAAEKRHITAKLIIICMRELDEASNLKNIELARKYAGDVVAVDLAGDESKTDHAAMPYRALFSKAADYGVPITIHAGEAAGPESIRAAIDMGAMRIGHGVRLFEDENLLHEVLEKGIALEMCPVSNIQTKSVPSWDKYPLPYYLRKGLLVTVNTDNPVLSDSSLTNEFNLLQEKCGITDNEIQILLDNSVKASFADPDTKSKLNRIIGGTA